MQNEADLEHRITVLLDLLDPDTAESLIRELPPARSQVIRQQMQRLHADPPTDEEVDEIISEFERFFRLADLTQPSPGKQSGNQHPTDMTPQPPDETNGLQAPTDGDPLGDLQRISPLRLAAALRDETPHTIALLLSRLPEERAAEVLQNFSDEKRYEAFLQMRDTPTAPELIVARLAKATVARGLSLPAEALCIDEEDIDTKMARMLRSMDRAKQFSILGSFEEADAESATRIRNMLYVCEDLVQATDRTLQQLLGEVDSRTLALILKEADDALCDKVFNNLSRRARETLEEELDLLGSVSQDELAEAKQTVVQAMVELDQRGELEMET